MQYVLYNKNVSQSKHLSVPQHAFWIFGQFQSNLADEWVSQAYVSFFKAREIS